jgi:hypothetical protein
MGIEHLLGPLFLSNPTCFFPSRSLLRGGDLEGGGCRGEGRGRLQWEGEGAARKGEGRAARKGKKGGRPPRVFCGRKETTPQMIYDLAFNGPQPFPTSTHQRSTFGQHFFGTLHHPRRLEMT